jgi:hypothetical protein
MKRLCVKLLKIDNATFLSDSEYEVRLHPHQEGCILLTDSRGIAVDIPTIEFHNYFI